MYYFNLFLLIWAISFIIYSVLLEKVLIFNNMNKLISINFYVCLKLLHFSIVFHMENSSCFAAICPLFTKINSLHHTMFEILCSLLTLLTLDTKIWQSPLFGSHDRLQMLMQKLHLLNEQVNKNSIALIYSRRMESTGHICHACTSALHSTVLLKEVKRTTKQQEKS